MTPLTPNSSVAMSGHRRRLVRRVAVVTTAVLLIGGTPLVAVALNGDDGTELEADGASVVSTFDQFAVPSGDRSLADGPGLFPAWSVPQARIDLEPASPVDPAPAPAPAPEPERSVAAAAAAEEQALADTLAVLADTYTWDETGQRVTELQEAVGLVADGRYDDATLGAHRAALELVGLPIDGLPLAPAPVVPSGTSVDGWAALRACESGGDYTVTNPSGKYRGAYQFDRSTWDSVAQRHDPALVGLDPAAAAPAEQDAMAHALYSERGAAPWPSCGRHL